MGDLWAYPYFSLLPVVTCLEWGLSGLCRGAEEWRGGCLPSTGRAEQERHAWIPNSYLEDSEDGGREGVKVGRWSLIFKVEPEKNKKSWEKASPLGARTWPLGTQH